MLKKLKIIIIVLVVIIVIAVIGYKFFFDSKESSFSFAVVETGSIVQEVSAIGQVKKGEEINLGFRDAGRIEGVYVEIGDEVKSGQSLIKLETTQLSIQLLEARAALDLAQAELDKLLVGASDEEIKISETAVENAEVSLADARQNLEDVEAEAEEDLNAAYEDALNELDNAYLKIYNAYNTADSVQRTYFTDNNQESFRVKDARDKIKRARDDAKTDLDKAKANSTDENVDLALAQMKVSLGNAYEGLEVIRENCEESTYKDSVSSADKTSLDNHKGYINNALTDITDAEQNISSTKIDNESDINTAESTVSTAEGTLKTAKDELALLTAEPRTEDVTLRQAQLRQAKANANLLEDKIYESTLRSSVTGQVTKIDKEVGEQVSVAETVISLLPQEPFQIEVDISEADISKIDLTDMVEITLDAFPETEFSGKVIEIEPAETIISGVVYYKTKVSLEAEDGKIKPGMTANVVIISATRNNILIVPSRAVKIEGDRKVVRRLINDEDFEEVEVETGLRGSGGNVEIISGLQEGDKVITFIKD